MQGDVAFLVTLSPEGTWIYSLTHSKANLLTPGGDEGKYSLYLQDTKQGVWVAHGQKPQLPDGFQGRIFKDSVRESVTECVVSLCRIL